MGFWNLNTTVDRDDLMLRTLPIFTSLLFLFAPELIAQSGVKKDPPVEFGKRTVPPPPASVAALLDEFEAARRSSTIERQVDVMLQAFYAPQDDVLQQVIRQLSSRIPQLRYEAVRVLRYIDQPKALDVLIKMAKNRNTYKDPEFAAQVLRAVGQYQDPAGLDALMSQTSILEHVVWSARIHAMSNIRDKRAVSELIEYFTKTAVASSQKGSIPIHEALHILTGESFKDPRAWTDWWKNQKDYEIPEAATWLTEDEKRVQRYRWSVPNDIREALSRRLEAKKN